MTKAALCVHCTDIVAPYRDWETNRLWRWCQCRHMAVRWADGARGLIEVTATHGPDYVRVLGISNLFLGMAVNNLDSNGGGRSDEQWRTLHDFAAGQVGPNYLFHKDRRNCWALVVRPGESGDITFVPYADVYAEESSPGGSVDRAPVS
jgi:hypothetical protein